MMIDTRSHKKVVDFSDRALVVLRHHRRGLLAISFNIPCGLGELLSGVTQ